MGRDVTATTSTWSSLQNSFKTQLRSPHLAMSYMNNYIQEYCWNLRRAGELEMLRTWSTLGERCLPSFPAGGWIYLRNIRLLSFPLQHPRWVCLFCPHCAQRQLSENTGIYQINHHTLPSDVCQAFVSLGLPSSRTCLAVVHSLRAAINSQCQDLSLTSEQVN